MPTILINVPAEAEAIDAFADCAHRYGLDNVLIHHDNGDLEEEGATLEQLEADLEAISGISDLVRGRTPEADLAPPHGIIRPTIDITPFGTQPDPTWSQPWPKGKRPTVTPGGRTERDITVKTMIRDTVECGHYKCGGVIGQWCTSANYQVYSHRHMHITRIQAWDALG